MKNPKVMLAVGVILLLSSPLFMRPVTCIKPVLDENGVQVIENGRRKFKPDPIGQFLVNWDANACLIAGTGLIIVGGVSIIVQSRRRKSEQPPAGDRLKAPPEE